MIAQRIGGEMDDVTLNEGFIAQPWLVNCSSVVSAAPHPAIQSKNF
jgi:hypothetical protein